MQKQQDEIFEKQQKAQKEAIEKQNQQIQDDTNNVIAATLLMDDAFAGGGKKVADAAKDVIEILFDKLIYEKTKNDVSLNGCFRNGVSFELLRWN